MRVQFDGNYSQNVDKVTTAHTSASSSRTEKTGAYTLDISDTVMDNAAYEVQGRTKEEIMQAAGSEDVALLRDYMTVMSNSMSAEDFAKLQKEGCNPMNTDIETVVTIVDKIKAQLARAGVDIAGYTDTLDMDILTAITGSESFARAITDAMKKADVPMTQENAAQITAAAKQAEELKEPSEGTEAYMVNNRLEPTADNFYRAEHSGAGHGRRRAGGYYQEELPGYYVKRADSREARVPEEQIEKVIQEAGLAVTQESMENAVFLIEKGIPLTAGNLQRLERIRQAQVPPDEEAFLKAAAAAMAEGKPAGEADLYDGRSCYEKAADMEADIGRLLEEAGSSGNVTQRRQLEEIRLMMTVEANVKLIKSGFSVDTSNLEELVEALKQLEQEQARQLFGAGEDPEGDYSLYKDTVQKTAELPYMPAAVVGRIAAGTAESTVNEIYGQGRALQKTCEEAAQEYETLMTAPRKDMGDNIRTAFRNIDAILEDIGMEATEQNRRAVRILGYNSMEINEENILAVKQADQKVQRVVEKMTPSATVQMIRDGVNPLETGLEELEQYLDGLETYDDEAQKYSRYLYNLEQNHEITPEEKESYIGIYRLLRQIEKTDGAAIGSLINSGAGIDFASLLSAVRTGKTGGMDVKVNESFGFVKQVTEKGVSITEQIAAGYTGGLTDTWSGEIPEQGYDAALLEEVRSIQQTENNVIRLLQKYELPVTVDHLLAMSHLEKDRGGGLRKLWEERGSSPDIPEAIEHMDCWEDMLTDKETAQATYGTYTQELMDTVEEQTFSRTETSLDVRAMQLVHKQLTIMQAAAGQEEFDIPVSIDGEMTAIHLSLQHDTVEKGKVSVAMESESSGRITVRLELENGMVKGYAAGEGTQSRELLSRALGQFSLALEGLGLKAADIPVVRGLAENIFAQSSRTSLTGERDTEKQEVETGSLYQVAKTFIQAFKRTVKA